MNKSSTQCLSQLIAHININNCLLFCNILLQFRLNCTEYKHLRMTVYFYHSVTFDDGSKTRNKLRFYKLFCYSLFASYHLSLSSTLSFVLSISTFLYFYFLLRLVLLHYISCLPFFLPSFHPSFFHSLFLPFHRKNFPAFSSFLSEDFSSS